MSPLSPVFPCFQRLHDRQGPSGLIAGQGETTSTVMSKSKDQTLTRSRCFPGTREAPSPDARWDCEYGLPLMVFFFLVNLKGHPVAPPLLVHLGRGFLFQVDQSTSKPLDFSTGLRRSQTPGSTTGSTPVCFRRIRPGGRMVWGDLCLDSFSHACICLFFLSPANEPASWTELGHRKPFHRLHH